MKKPLLKSFFVLSALVFFQACSCDQNKKMDRDEEDDQCSAIEKQEDILPGKQEEVFTLEKEETPPAPVQEKVTSISPEKENVTSQASEEAKKEAPNNKEVSQKELKSVEPVLLQTITASPNLLHEEAAPSSSN